MKLRTWLLILLTALLPVRGVMAAAMLCPPGATDEAMATSAAHGEHARAGHEAAADAHHHDGQPAKSACNLCSTCCSVPPLPSAALGLPLRQDLATVDYPPLAVPAPSFLSDGQERPPRSI